MIISIEEARPEHVHDILENLREREKRILSSLADPAAALTDEVRKSTKAYAGLLDGEVACLWGMHIRTLLADAVYLWMLTSTAVEQHPFVFVRHSQRMAQAILEEYGTIEGFVWLDNPMSEKWLKWLGATIEDSPLKGAREFRLRRAS